MQQYGHPNVFAAFFVGECEKHAKRHTDNKLRRDTLQGCFRAVKEQVQRQMPQAPQNTHGQRTAPRTEAVLQGGRQVAAPTVFLAKERQEGQKEIGNQRHRHDPRCGAAPVGQVVGPSIPALHCHREEHHAGLDGEEVHADSKCRQKFAVQAQAVGFTALLFLGQQQYPAQRRGNNNDNVGNGQPPRLRHSHGQHTHNQHQHGGHDVQTVKPLGRIRPPHQQEGQHDTRRRVEHLGVGKNACILPVLQADV